MSEDGADVLSAMARGIGHRSIGYRGHRCGKIELNLTAISVGNEEKERKAVVAALALAGLNHRAACRWINAMTSLARKAANEMVSEPKRSRGSVR
ncbi:MAG: hypothetical protein IPN78_17445 [Candidatus Accumulibacter sp.]|nr:hypothetical protein [Candidatus Accumulibacter propinquus]